MIGSTDAAPRPADDVDRTDTGEASVSSEGMEPEETAIVDRIKPGSIIKEAFSRQSLKREFASMLDMALFVAVPIALWLFAPLDPWFWVLIGVPAMMAAMFLSAFIQTLLGVRPAKMD